MSSDTLFVIQKLATGAIVAALLLAGYWLYDKIHLRNRIKIANENLYNKRYTLLKDMIYSYELHRDNYGYLKTQLLWLGQMGFKDHERTSVLTTEFFNRFNRFALDEIREESQPDEFSVESIFSEYD